MTFVGRFFLLVLTVGFIELYLLIKVGGALGFFPTVGLCVLTGVIGGALVRHQGLRTLQQIQLEMSRGRVPTAELISGVVLLVVGAMLVLPGFLSDTIGFFLLVPMLRERVAQRLAKVAAAHVTMGPTPWAGTSEAGPRGPQAPIRGKVIDVQPEEVTSRAEADDAWGRSP